MKNIYSKNPFLTLTLSVVLGVLVVVSGVGAATTISTSIVTGGDLTVTGNSTLTGTLAVTAKTTLVNASTTRVSIGTNGTSMNQVIHGSCTLIGGGASPTPPSGIDASQTASTTAPYDCAVTGVVSGDIVLAQFSTSTPMYVSGWVIEGAKASTTAGYITVLVANLTGIARVPSASGVGSSTAYIIIR